MSALEQLLAEIVGWIEQAAGGRPLIVAIDGIDAAGKTTFAGQLAEALRARGAQVVQVSVDGFHNPASVRHARAAADPAESYYEDSFDYESFRRLVLEPLQRSTSPTVVPRIFDHVSDSPVEPEHIEVALDAIVLVDGIFMGRRELARSWNCWIYLHAEPDVARSRGVERDEALYGTQTLDRYLTRYEPGQALYQDAVDPLRNADVVIDNTNPQEPSFVRFGR